jgi:uncharacterized protein (TIGR03083 family)
VAEGQVVNLAYRDDVFRALEDAAERFARLIAATRDPTVRVAGTPDWTVKQAAAHVVNVIERYAQGPRGEGEWVSDPSRLPALNESQLPPFAEHSMDELAQMTRETTKSLIAQVRSYGDSQPTFHFHGGEVVRADTALGILLGELEVHGWDIARAVDGVWPIDPHHVELIFQGVEEIVPGWVDRDTARGISAVFELKLRGEGRRVFAFHDGALDVNPVSAPRVDVHISADPVALLLVLYGRESQWNHVVRGHLFAWGRKPWLALKLAAFFHNP